MQHLSPTTSTSSSSSISTPTKHRLWQEDEPYLQGNLLKLNTRGLFRNKWKRRMFIVDLKEALLLYYTKTGPPKRVMAMRHILTEHENGSTILRLSFEGSPEVAPMTLQAPSPFDAEEWATVLRRAREIGKEKAEKSRKEQMENSPSLSSAKLRSILRTRTATSESSSNSKDNGGARSGDDRRREDNNNNNDNSNNNSSSNSNRNSNSIERLALATNNSGSASGDSFSFESPRAKGMRARANMTILIEEPQARGGLVQPVASSSSENPKDMIIIQEHSDEEKEKSPL